MLPLSNFGGIQHNACTRLNALLLLVAKGVLNALLLPRHREYCLL